jgi:tetratricopeptide (TPR) repeat protein
VDRAQSVRPDFQLTRANAAAVAALCARLEGLPLALELATARAGVLTPAQMLARLEQRFELLVRRGRPADARHRSLRATLDWSYRLLSPELQRFFCRLSVFRGGWTVEGAEAAAEEPRALEYVQELQECSMVQAMEPGARERGGGEVRFRLLEALREYGAEQLPVEERAALMRRHASYFLALAEQAAARLPGPGAAVVLDQLEQEHDNLQAVLDWATDDEETEWGLRLAGALVWFWAWRNYLTEGSERLTRLLALDAAARRRGAGEDGLGSRSSDNAMSTLDSGGPRAAEHLGHAARAIRARALAGASLLSHLRGKRDLARLLVEESVAIGRELGDKRLLAGTIRCHGSLGILARCAMDEREVVAAGRLFREQLAIGRELGDRWIIASALHGLGQLASVQGEPAAARACYEHSQALWRELDYPWGVASALGCLGGEAYARGELQTAGALWEESLTLWRQLGEKVNIADLLGTLGEAAQRAGNYQRAETLYMESMALYRDIGHRGGIAYCREALAKLAAAQQLKRRGADASAWRPGTARPLAQAYVSQEARGAALTSAGRSEQNAALTAPLAISGEGAGASAADRLTPLCQLGSLGLPAARTDLSLADWQWIAPLLPTSDHRRGRPYEEHRRVINAILWKLRTGAPWRDLPAGYGSWHTCHDRYRRWRCQGLWDQIEQALRRPPEPAGE